MVHSIQIGAAVAQFGQFGLHVIEVYNNDLLIPTNRYQVVVTDESLKVVELGSIEKEKSNLAGLLDYLLHWLRGQYIQIYQAKQWLNESEDSTKKEGLQVLLDRWEPRYQLVVNALREIEPGYLPDESVPEPGITWKTGNIVKQYGRFLLRELIGQKGSHILQIAQYNLSLDTGTGEEFRIGSIPLTQSDLEDVLKLLHNWLDYQASFKEQLKQEVSEEQDIEQLKQRQQMLGRVEYAFQLVQNAVNEVEFSMGT